MQKTAQYELLPKLCTISFVRWAQQPGYVNPAALS